MNTDTELETEPALLQDLDRLAGVVCAGCSCAICGHEVLCSIALGFKNSPRCLACLASGLRKPVEELRDQLLDYMQRRECYNRAWDIASDREGLPRERQPGCLQGQRQTGPSARVKLESPTPQNGTVEWDAGDMGCGDLVLALRLRMRELPPHGAIRVTALDPAAPEDLPAWCRLTGHHLLNAEHPVYLIQRKD